MVVSGPFRLLSGFHRVGLLQGLRGRPLFLFGRLEELRLLNGTSVVIAVAGVSCRDGSSSVGFSS